MLMFYRMRVLGFLAIATVASERLPPGSATPSGVPSSLISRPGVVLHSVHGGTEPPSASSLVSRTGIEKSSAFKCVRGDLELAGFFQVYKPVDLGFCERIIAHNATVILSAPLRFRSTGTSLEFSGNLTLKGAKEGFACMVVKGEFVMTEGSFLSISGCKQNSNLLWANDADVASGGGIKADYFRQMGGTILISNTVGARGGGAISALGGFQLLNGLLFINDAVAWNSGGAIRTNHFHQNGGNLTISNSSAHFHVHDGIGYEEMHYHNDFGEEEETDGEAEAYFVSKLAHNQHDPGKKLVGGGAIFASVMNHSGGSITIEDAFIRAVGGPGEGGAICSNQFIISGSASMSIRHTRALALRQGGSGGGLRVGSYQQLGGSLIMEDSQASTDQMTPDKGRGPQRTGAFGGCIFAESLEMLRGNMTLRWCRAEGDRMSLGGAIYVRKDVLQAGGNILIEHSYAHSIDDEGAGGAFYVTKVVTQQSGSLEIRNCSAKGPLGGNGGAMKAKCLNQYDTDGLVTSVTRDLKKEHLQQQILLEDCSAETLGGGLYLGFEAKADVHDRENGLMQGDYGVLHIRGCSASSGGGLYTPGTVDTYGETLMQDCIATEGSGGCLRSEDTAFLHNVTFDGCYADQSAAAMQSYSSNGLSALRNATFRHCYSGASRSIAVFDRVQLESVTVVGNINASDPLERQEIVVLFAAESKQLTCNTNCAIEMNFGGDVSPRKAHWNLVVHHPQVKTLVCPVGYGRHDDNTSSGCERCSLGQMQMEKAVNGTCQACPSEAAICEATRMKIPRGMMVHPHDLTRAWHCPNHLACPGAVLETLPGKVEDHSQLVLQTMCQSGYTALGCVKCVESYGRLDNNPLGCTECSDSSWHTLGIFAFYILKDSWLLFVAAATAPSPDASKPWSAVLMNQLMTFALLANILMSSLLQTTCIAHFSGVIRTFVDFSDLFLSFFSPSCGGAGNLGISVDCLLRQVEGSRSLRSSLCIMTGLPLLLMLIFGAVKVEPLLALIVGLNVFMPGCMAVFGSYFVAFRFSPYPSDLEMPFMPESNMDRFTLALCIISCFAVAIAFWRIVMIKREASPLPRYVVYLTQSFKPTYCVWEMERFVRKLCLALISTMIPATVSPALKMELVSVVLIASLALHSHFQPHKVESWNHLEIGLLSLSQFLTGVTGTLMVSDIYWSNEMTSGVQILMVLIIITLLTVICATLAGLLLWNLYHEDVETAPLTTSSSKDAADEELPID